jgi:hypothetical protein
LPTGSSSFRREEGDDFIEARELLGRQTTSFSSSIGTLFVNEQLLVSGNVEQGNVRDFKMQMLFFGSAIGVRIC